MDIDSYQQCPCHSEKKIKFCCGKGIVGDLNQILAKNRSGQPASALEQLERTIKNTGPKDCLLTLQTHILISIGEIEKAKQSNDLFMEKNQGHSMGFHHQALILLSEGEIEQAVDALQNAMDGIKGNEIPISLANAFRMVGMGLFSAGNFIAAKGHFRYAMALKGESDPELERIGFEITRSPHVPMFVKQEFHLAPVPEEVEWEKKYVNVLRALDRGQFRLALKFLRRIDADFPDIPLVCRGIAIVASFLGNAQVTCSAWHHYSRMKGVSKIEGIEAELISQIYSQDPVSQVNPILRLTIELTESEGAFELAVSSLRLVFNPPPESDPFQEGPAPRFMFSLLSQDKGGKAEGLTIDTIPVVLGEVLCFGKQTDRPARLEVVAVKNSSFESVTGFIADTFADYISGDPVETTIGESSSLEELFEWQWDLPEDLTRKQHSELVKLKRQSVLLNDWPKIKLGPLGNRSPEEASGDPELELPLQAMVLMLENSAQGLLFDDDLASELRSQLRLMPIDSIDVSQSELSSSPIQQQFIEWNKLSDEQLVAIRNDAIQVSNFRVLQKVVPEILSRPELTMVPRDLSFSMMAQMSQDEDKALEYLGLARAEADKSGRPIGLYLVQEFEYRLSRGMTEQLPDLLQTIQRSHLDDPAVKEQLAQVLGRYGLGPEQLGPESGAPGHLPDQTAAPDAAGQAGRIWTPDQGTPPAPSEAPKTSESSSDSGLWIPE